MKDETFPPINGDEVQVQGFQFAIHDGDDLDDAQENIIKKLQTAFKGETAHKIVRVSYQRGAKSFIFNAGFDESMYNEVGDWIEQVSHREHYPMVFEFRNFVSYNPPTLV